jgi:RHS repeat-associated protein
VTDTYDYDAFGNLIAKTGTTVNNYLFAGEQFDPALGIYYNRARYYDQRQGRFWTMDSFEGSANEPATLHRYLYTTNNPISLVDPSGLDFLSDAETGDEVQHAIGIKFIAQYGPNACVDQQIIHILESDCSAPREFGMGFPGGLRPDLANVQTGALFEIKPIDSAAEALPQIFTYQNILSLVDPKGRNWHLGTAAEFLPPTKVVLKGGLRVAYIAPPVLGVIIYFVADARDAFDLSLLAATSILPALLKKGAARAISRPSNVISISRGTGVANAASAAGEAEVEGQLGIAELEDNAA